jgi:hypothetical protein
MPTDMASYPRKCELSIIVFCVTVHWHQLKNVWTEKLQMHLTMRQINLKTNVFWTSLYEVRVMYHKLSAFTFNIVLQYSDLNNTHISLSVLFPNIPHLAKYFNKASAY